MRIAIAIERLVLDRGGSVSRTTLDVVSELAERGHEVTLVAGVCLPLDSQRKQRRLSKQFEWRDGITIHAATRCRVPAPWHLPQFVRHWRQTAMPDNHDDDAARPFDLTLSTTSRVAADVMMPLTSLMLYRRQYQAHDHEADRSAWGCARQMYAKAQSLWRYPLTCEQQSLTSPRVRCFIAVSSSMAAQFQAVEGLATDRLIHWTWTPPLAAQSPQQRRAQRQAMRRSLSIGEDQPVLMFATMNPDRKGFAHLLPGLKLVREQGGGAVEPEMVVLMAGPWRYRHLQAVARAELRGAVRFIGKTDHIEHLYAAADACVIPAQHDPFSRTVMESLLHQTPVIAGAGDGAAELVTPRDHAPRGLVMSQPADAGALAEAMRQITQPDFNHACRAACKDLRETLKSMPTIVQIVESDECGVMNDE